MTFLIKKPSAWVPMAMSIFVIAFVLNAQWHHYAWLIVPLGIIGMEWYALTTSRWAYNVLMPIIPLLGTGLTPTIQLGLLGHLSYKFALY